MTVTVSEAALVTAPGLQVSFSNLFTITSTGADPEYLVLTGFDRNEYTAAGTGSTVSVSGNGSAVKPVNPTGVFDDSNIGIVFTYTAQGYYNSTYGYLSDLQATASKDNDHSTYFSLYGYGTAGTQNTPLLGTLTTLANAATSHVAEQFFVLPPSGDTYYGSIDLVTRTGYTDPTPNTATPGEVAQVGLGFVGQTWNINGCWVLVSNIAAAAGASLPVGSSDSVAYAPAVGNGEWIVAYDSTKATAAQQESWQAQLRPGDVVSYNQYCGGHIFTIVSGSGYNAMLVDNTGNSAADGNVNDIVIGAAHSVNDTFVQGHGLIQDVVIYRLDTPVITALAPVSVQAGGSATLAGDFTAQDPAGKSVTSYQIYDTGTGSFTVAGAASSAHTSATALTVSAANMTSAAFSPGTATDTIMIRAFNGSYWGDWQSLTVDVGSGASAPTVAVTQSDIVVRTGTQAALTSLVSASAGASPIASYTIYDPNLGEWGSGHIVLNGVTPLSTGTDAAGGTTYQIAAADFAKLSYAGGGYVANGEDLSISATNAAGVTSAAIDLPIWSAGLGGNEISHYLTPGTTVAITSLYVLTGIDSDFPMKLYNISTDYAAGDQLTLNGATNLIPAASFVDSTGWAHYEISAADIGKITFTVGTGGAALGDEIIISPVDSADSVANFFPKIHAATETVLISAPAITVTAGVTVAMSSLFTVKNAAPITLYHIYDPSGGGTVNLNGATNELGVQAGTGEYLVSAQDLAQVTYTGGTGTDALLITTSTDDGQTWAPETTLAVTGALDSTSAAAAQAPAAPLVVADSVANISANLDALQVKAAEGELASITPTDAGFPIITATAAQLASDAAAIADLSGNFILDVDASAANAAITGLATHATVAVFTAKAANYTVTPSGDGTSFTVTDSGTGRSSVDHLSAITALQFSDGTDFIANAPSAGGVTSGNVAELYSAVLARTPDVAGLAFYEGALKTDPTLSMLTLARYFLASPEYTGNSAHNYAQSDAGDASFITDTYTNLLHRAPDTGAVAFYQAVIDKFTAGLTVGTAAFQAAQIQGHAQVLVYFSASSEFLGDVQVTATHPADAQHWLILI
jgi:hypothetical protein